MPSALPALRAAAAQLAAVDPLSLSPAALGDAVVELRAVIDGLEGAWSRLVAVLDGTGAGHGGTGAFLRSACRLSPSVARSRVVLSRRLAERPAVAAALSAGDISVDHARLVTTALAELAAVDEQLAARTEAPLAAAAARVDPARLRREIAHARHALVPEAAASAEEAVHARRRLDVATTFEGSVAVSGLLDPEGGEALRTALAALSARTGPADDRTPGQRRADALVELCHRQLDRAELPALGGERPHLTVLVPLAALPSPTPGHRHAALGCAATSTTDPTAPATTGAGDPTLGTAGSGPTMASAAGSAPARIGAGDPTLGTAASGGADGPTNAGAAGSAAPGVGAGGMVGGETVWGAVLAPAAVRRLACDASITRVVLGPDSQPLDVGRRSRVIPPAIRAALTVRDRGCVFPGCDRPPSWTDAHHVVHWADGGPTSLDNLALLCRTHHRTVHEGQSTLSRAATGHWTVATAGHAPPRAA